MFTDRRGKVGHSTSFLSAQMVGQEETVPQRTLLTSTFGTDGFTLIEMVCVLAVIALVAAIISPALTDTESKLSMISIRAASILKQDRDAAMLTHRRVRTEIDATKRIIKSGTDGRSVSVPGKFEMKTVLAYRCGREREGRGIEFYPSGMSCGGTITLEGAGRRSEIRVNWITGAVDIVSKND
jgi:general secretion pathway protein H